MDFLKAPLGENWDAQAPGVIRKEQKWAYLRPSIFASELIRAGF
jgi:hypothetical protein